MPARRIALVVASSAALLLGAAGCEKPSPTVTMVANGTSVHATAINFCRGGHFLTKINGRECPSDGRTANVISVYDGDRISFDVDKDLTKTGWYVYDLDHNQSLGFQDEHYFSIYADFSNRPVKGVMNFEVRKIDHKPVSNTDLPKTLGQWEFQVTQKS